MKHQWEKKWESYLEKNYRDSTCRSTSFFYPPEFSNERIALLNKEPVHGLLYRVYILQITNCVVDKNPLYFIQKGRQFNTNVKWWMITVRIAQKKWNSDEYYPNRSLANKGHFSDTKSLFFELVPSTPKDTGFMDGAPCLKCP